MCDVWCCWKEQHKNKLNRVVSVVMTFVFSAPCIQAMDWTDWVFSYSGACSVYSSLQTYIYKTGTCHVVILFLILFLPADIVWQKWHGAPALTVCTQLFLAKHASKCSLYWRKKCCMYNASSKVLVCAKFQALCFLFARNWHLTEQICDVLHLPVWAELVSHIMHVLLRSIHPIRVLWCCWMCR